MKPLQNFLTALIITCLFLNTATSATTKQNIKSDYTHFSFKLDSFKQNNQLSLKPVHQKIISQSDEYWFQLNGKELNKGIPINLTQAGALIRITQGVNHDNAGLSQSLDSKKLLLLSSKVSGNSLIEKVISENSLSQVGLFKNTIALKTRADSQARELTLRSLQTLSENDLYVVSVKEKNSPYLLNLQLSSQVLSKRNGINATAQIYRKNQLIPPTKLLASLVAPDGESHPVDYHLDHEGKIHLNLIQPEKIISPINGLYEVQLVANAVEQGVIIKRNIKLALAISNPTARLLAATFDAENVEANLSLSVDKSSRYEVRGVLYATTMDGQLIPAIETHAAQSLTAGKQQLTLPFNQQFLIDNKLVAPYEVRLLRLIDQKQMALIDTFSETINSH